MRRFHIVIACVIVLAIVAVAAMGAVYEMNAPGGNGGPKDAAAPASAAPASPGPGRMAAFVVHPSPMETDDVAFEAADGGTVRLSDFRGKVVLLNLWATWCGPCRVEMPALDRLQAKLGGDDFQVVPVSLDRGAMDKPLALFEELGIAHLDLYQDPSARLGSRLRAVGMPTTLLFDRQGREIGRLAGPAEWDSEAAIATIRETAGLAGES